MDLRLNLDYLKQSDDEDRVSANESDNSNESENEADENPFAISRDIGTVKVNEARKPLAETLKEQEKKSSTTTTEMNNYLPDEESKYFIS